jgi:hypothetical protein
MPLPRPKTGVPRGSVSDEVKLMLFEPEVAGFAIAEEAGGTFSVTPLARGAAGGPSGPVGRAFMPKRPAGRPKPKRGGVRKTTKKAKAARRPR